MGSPARRWGEMMEHPSDPARPDDERRGHSRMWIWLLGCLLPVLLGCTSDDPLTGFNSWSEIGFDGHTVGVDWDTSGQAISCERESDTGALVRLVDRERWPDDDREWRIEGGTEIGMHLELPGPGRAASIELTVGDAVYRSDARTKSKIQARPGDRGVYRDSTGARFRIDGLVGGRAVFRAVPLLSGEPFEDKARLDRLVVAWDCVGRPSMPARSYSRQ